MTRGIKTALATTALVSAIALMGAPAGAQTLRWSAAGDAVSFDPNAQVDSFTQNILLMVYDTAGAPRTGSSRSSRRSRPRGRSSRRIAGASSCARA